MGSITKNCKCCGKVFKISSHVVATMQAMGYPLPERCKACNAMKKEVTHIKCKDCDDEFTFTKMEEHLLKKKFGAKYRAPQYCRKCRSDWKSKNGGKK